MRRLGSQRRRWRRDIGVGDRGDEHANRTHDERECKPSP
jgi:hypothetical protein